MGTEMRIALCTLIILACNGCSSGGGSNTSTNDPPPPLPPPANSAPTISGAPPLQVVVGQTYSFTPVATDTDNDTLTFSIVNRPPWTGFDSITGSLTGIPAAADIDTTPGITISVSDGTDSASLAPFDLEVQPVQLGSATVFWDIPTTNADGSNLDDLAGFNIHYGQQSGNYSDIVVINDNTATSTLIEDLSPGAWYFAVSAFDLVGNESDLSAEVSKVVNQ